MNPISFIRRSLVGTTVGRSSSPVSSSVPDVSGETASSLVVAKVEETHVNLSREVVSSASMATPANRDVTKEVSLSAGGAPTPQVTDANPKEINIIFKSEYALLSNFAKTGFELNLSSIFIAHQPGAVHFGSMEAFVQAIKFPCPDKEVSVEVAKDRARFMEYLGFETLSEYQKYWHDLAKLSGPDARKFRSVPHAVRELSGEHDYKYFYVMQQRFDYSSPMRLLVLEEGLRQKFIQNRLAKKQLLATGDATLKHELPNTNVHQTIISPKEFANILEKLRSEFLLGEK